MGRIARTAAYAAAGGLLFTGLGYSTDHFMFTDGVRSESDSYLPGYDVENIADAREATAELNVLWQEAQQDKARVEKEIGEACVSFLEYYLPKDSFSGSGQDVAVEDGVRDPKKPCGESRRDIRVDYDNLTAANDDLSNASSFVFEAEQAVAYYEKATRDDNNFSGARHGAVVGVVLGGLTGLFRRERRNITVPIVYETGATGE